ncbi:MAG: ATP-binding protein [bacterium]|nr:ATP-binding protein [bacterium]
MAKSSPFIYGNTVSNIAFTNREIELDKLMSNLLGGVNTMIISPRRWGKSSLVEKVVTAINRKEKRNKTIVIDLFSVSNEQQFLETFTREVIKASSNRWQEWLGSGALFFKKLIPKINVGIDPLTDFSIGFDWKELKKHSEEVLNLPEVIAKKKGIKFIICLDEFQNIASFDDYLNFEKKMRSVWQRQKLVTYCLYGSKRHMMTDIFNNPSKPFYRFGDIMLLPKIQKEKWIGFVVKSFKESGKTISAGDAAFIPEVMKNHSWYVQQLSHYTWNLTSKTAGLLQIKAALNELIQANSPLYQKEVESISVTQLNLLKAVAVGEHQFTSTAVMQIYALGTPRNVSKNKTILINNDIIQNIDGVYEFVDPAFELWFKKQFFNQSY